MRSNYCVNQLTFIPSQIDKELEEGVFIIGMSLANIARLIYYKKSNDNKALLFKRKALLYISKL